MDNPSLLTGPLEYSLKLKQGYWDSCLANRKRENSIRITNSMQMLKIIIYNFVILAVLLEEMKRFLDKSMQSNFKLLPSWRRKEISFLYPFNYWV